MRLYRPVSGSEFSYMCACTYSSVYSSMCLKVSTHDCFCCVPHWGIQLLSWEDLSKWRNVRLCIAQKEPISFSDFSDWTQIFFFFFSWWHYTFCNDLSEFGPNLLPHGMHLCLAAFFPLSPPPTKIRSRKHKSCKFDPLAPPYLAVHKSQCKGQTEVHCSDSTIKSTVLFIGDCLILKTTRVNTIFTEKPLLWRMAQIVQCKKHVGGLGQKANWEIEKRVKGQWTRSTRRKVKTHWLTQRLCTCVTKGNKEIQEWDL